MAQGRQAKILSDRQIKAVLSHLESTRYPERDQVMFLLSTKAGFRAKEIASVTWSMVTDSEGQVADTIALEDRASKGKRSGRSVPVHPHLKSALERLQAARGAKARPDWPVIYSERDKGLSPGSVTVWFHRLYKSLGMQGCSSHSGRRTFVTRAAQNITKAGGSLRDVQQLAGDSSLQTTQRYIEGDAEAKKKVVAMI